MSMYSCSKMMSDVVVRLAALRVCEDCVMNQTSNNHSLTDLLPDDCLINIFSHLDVADRLRSEAVCKRWQLLSRKSWRYVTSVVIDPSATTSVCLEMTSHICSHMMQKEELLFVNTIDTGIIRQLLSRCGRYVTGLTFHDHHKLATDYMVSIVAEYCHNITQCVLFLNKSCESAKKVLLAINKNIRLLKIAPLRDIRCLNHVTMNSLAGLSLDVGGDVGESFVDPLNKILPQCTLLYHLHLNFFNEETLEIIGNFMKELRHLSLVFARYNTENTRSLLNIPKLTELAVLDLYYSHITDDIMCRIVEGCNKLDSVKISDCWRLTDRGIMKIFTLPNLTTLDFSRQLTITDEVLTFIPQTVHCVYLYDCPNITDDGVVSLIRGHPNLESLTILSCNSLTLRTIHGAVDATEDREEDGVVLEMVINKFNDLDIEEINTSPFLDVIVRNY